MRFSLGRRTRLALLGVISLAAITLLASGLREITFRAGQPVGEREAATASLPVTRLVEDLADIPIWKQLVAWAIVFLIVLLVSTILSPELRRRLIRTFLRFMVALAALYYLATNYGYLFRGLGLIRGAVATGEADPASAGPPPVFQAPQLSPWLIFLVSLLVALTLVGVVWGARRWWRRRLAGAALDPSMDDLADIARESLDKLSAGDAWGDVITESYLRMSWVVGKRRGLIRQEAMTPSEFAARLERAGLPAHAVRKLTRLFESVRYGAHTSTSDEIKEAVSCLTDILNYCGEAA